VIINAGSSAVLPLPSFARRVIRFITADGREQAVDIMVVGGSFQEYAMTGQDITVDFDVTPAGLVVTNNDASSITVKIYNLLRPTQISI